MENKTILLVEDNPNDVELTLHALTKSKIKNEVIVVTNGADALDYLFGKGKYAGRDISVLPTLTLLDIQLPKIDGLEVLKRIRANPLTENIPVVILTSSKEEHDIIKGYSYGVNSFVRKPVDFIEFKEAINSLGMYWLFLNETPPKGKIDFKKYL